MCFIANDAVYDKTVAFLNSLHTHSSYLPVCWIPFDDRCRRVRALAESFGCTEFNDLGVLRKCDELSLIFHSEKRGAYRKFALWSGPFERFVYIDVDTVVVHDIGFAFDLLDDFDILTSHSNMPQIRRWVWKDSIDDSGLLSTEQIAFAANTGFIVSSRRFGNFELLASRVEAAAAARQHMALQCMEQPALNHAIVTSGKRYGSISELVRKGSLRPAWSELHAGTGGWRVKGGQIKNLNPFSRRRVFLVHWAGFRNPNTFPYRALWQHYRDMKCAGRFRHPHPQQGGAVIVD
ncbi:hypothetical protein [Elongatibacter sediminis]|uniref:Glycosyl transferase n=1 Tax=Elongatibacter sediminis TaxID=3119006 RepID=A0AAW9RGS4_9GAMM